MGCTPQELVEAAKCIECGVPAGMRLPVLISLWCEIVESGVCNGGGGGGQNIYSWEPSATPLTLGLYSFAGMAGITTLNLLETTNSEGFDIENAADLVTLNLPSMTFCGSQFLVSGCAALVTINAPVLATVDQLRVLSSGMATLTFPALTTITSGTQITANGNLTTINLPALTLANTAGNFTINNNAALVTISCPQVIFTDGTISCDGNALDAASVNLILARCVASGLTVSTIDLGGGTNAAPSGQGIVDKADLITAGNTVNTN